MSVRNREIGRAQMRFIKRRLYEDSVCIIFTILVISNMYNSKIKP